MVSLLKKEMMYYIKVKFRLEIELLMEILWKEGHGNNDSNKLPVGLPVSQRIRIWKDGESGKIYLVQHYLVY